MTTAETYARQLGSSAREASLKLRAISHTKRVQWLKKLAANLGAAKNNILTANHKDLRLSKKNGLSEAMVDRLSLNEKRLDGIIKSVKEIAGLEDPLGVKLNSYIRQDKLNIRKVTVPIGSIFFIFESRPNVTIDGAALCLKSGNAVVLRGGKESKFSNEAFARVIRATLKQMNFPEKTVQLVNRPDRNLVKILLQDTENFDLVIPRGGETLIETVVENSRIPVIKHYKGLCHIYIDKSAEMREAGSIVINAKVQRPGVCNAMETLLVDENIDKRTVRKLLGELADEGVELKGCEKTRKIMGGISKALPEDWEEEYLDMRLSVKMVRGIDGAIKHINRYGSGHTDAVLAQSKNVQKKFLENIDSSSVMVNASTRFADGGEYGLGAEVGISTDKLHARGPMGIESLATYQWQVIGNNHVRN